MRLMQSKTQTNRFLDNGFVNFDSDLFLFAGNFGEFGVIHFGQFENESTFQYSTVSMKTFFKQKLKCGFFGTSINASNRK